MLSLCTSERYVFAADRAFKYRRVWLWECDRQIKFEDTGHFESWSDAREQGGS